MTEFRIHSHPKATKARKAVLERAKRRFGYTPNLFGALSEAPAVADAYFCLSDLLARSTLTQEELQVVFFALNAFHDCDYCMAVDSAHAREMGISEDVIRTARSGGEYADPKLEALRLFSLEMVESRGWVGEDALEAFIAAGFTKANVLEIILATAQRTISNYASHVVMAPLDEEVAQFKWKRPNIAAE